MGEFLIPLENMFLLLNGLFLGGSRSFVVRSLLLKLDLFRVTLGAPRSFSWVGSTLPRDVYEERRNGCGDFIGEIPSYRDYLDVFLGAGVHTPEGWDVAVGALRDALDWNPFEGHRPVYVSFDTNALILRYYTRISRLLAELTRGSPMRVGFVASKGVLDELEGFDEKYKERDISLMGRTLDVNREVLDQFFNQLRLEGRLFRMGFTEYRKMSKREHFEEVEGGKGDTKIVKSLENFSKRRNVDLIVFSEDSDFIAKATAHRLRGVRLDRPHEAPESLETGWEEIAQLLYTSAITFGAIGVAGRVKAKIFGVWKGKKGEHWDGETLRVTTENPELQEFLEKNIRILEG